MSITANINIIWRSFFSSTRYTQTMNNNQVEFLITVKIIEHSDLMQKQKNTIALFSLFIMMKIND